MKISAFPAGQFADYHHAHWLDRIARKAVFRLLKSLKHGHIVLHEDGQSHVFGEELERSNCDREPLSITIVVEHKSFYRMVMLRGSIGAAEAYMAGCWTTDNLTNVIRLIARNMQHLEKMDGGLTKLTSIATALRHRLSSNSVKGSKRNIGAHYDLSNDLFKLFLDENMMYSSGVFPTPNASLEEASTHKLQLLADKLQLKAEHHVVEIGTGWGGMATFIARNYGCKVTTTTISEEQYEYTCHLVKREGLENLVTVLDQDYRLLEGHYDRLISVEMIEAVGHEYFPTFFKKCNSLVKKGGRMVLQAITIPEQRYQYAKRNVDFIQRYIFPGGCLPSVEVMLNCTGKYTAFQLDQLDDIGLDYAQTLQIWRQRFEAAIPQVEMLGFDKAFHRLWEFYLCYCEGGFRERAISTVQIGFLKV